MYDKIFSIELHYHQVTFMIAQTSIEALRTQLDVVDVISNYIELKKSGANFKAPCPFHSEDSPSFVVSPQKQIYHCFGCGVGGDSIKFVMEYEKLNYPEAIEKLAEQNNFRLEYTDKQQKQIDTKIMDALHNWYKKLFEQHQAAKAYIHDRGIFESSIEKFGISYAPDSNATIQFLRQNMYNLNEAVELGVIGYNEGRYFGRFVERIMFPIYAANGKIVGFGGRTITGHQAKYINSPQTKLFNKSKLLYAYNFARDSIYKRKEMIVTEGYLDVIMLHQAGFTNAVATLGTALTAEHIPLLRKGEPKIIMAYDGDNAGINAALKASKMLSAAGFDGGVVIFGEGMDPADMVHNDQINELNTLLKAPKKMPVFVLEVIISAYNLNDPYEKEKALHECVGYIKTLSLIMQDEYKSLLSALLGISKGLVRLQPSDKKTNTSISTTLAQSKDIWELTLIKTLLESPALTDTVMEYVDISMLRRHQQEYNLLLTNQLDHPLILAITLDDSIKTFDPEDLEKELLIFLTKYYTLGIRYINTQQDMDFKEKSARIKAYQSKIKTLKSGVLVSY